MALWTHITKFGSWSVATHVTIFATEVDKHAQSSMLSQVSSMAYNIVIKELVFCSLITHQTATTDGLCFP